MNLQDYASIAGIISIFVSGSAVILVWIARVFWGLTFDRKCKDDELRFEKIEINLRMLNEAEEKNKYVRHNFEAVTKALELHISSEINHLREHLTIEIQHLEEIIDLKFIHGKNS